MVERRNLPRRSSLIGGTVVEESGGVMVEVGFNVWVFIIVGIRGVVCGGVVRTGRVRGRLRGVASSGSWVNAEPVV